ncbi:MAG TPA: shikimate kinase [Bryobacteraceae bacterium]|jgi:shikimate kinase|nr:shikimate kinase [Bryobacteraceae bacterium]
MHLKLKRTPGIFITGFMGSGKTTVGRIVAERLGWEFVDLDRDIEERERDTIANIFAKRGESEFRRIETEAIQRWLRKIECGSPTVIALGGGAFVQPRNYEMLGNNGISVWLDCSLDVVEARLADAADTRPLARDKEAFRKLYNERKVLYGRADFRVNGDLDYDQAAGEIVKLPLWN